MARKTLEQYLKELSAKAKAGHIKINDIIRLLKAHDIKQIDQILQDIAGLKSGSINIPHLETTTLAPGYDTNAELKKLDPTAVVDNIAYVGTSGNWVLWKFNGTDWIKTETSSTHFTSADITKALILQKLGITEADWAKVIELIGLLATLKIISGFKDKIEHLPANTTQMLTNLQTAIDAKANDSIDDADLLAFPALLEL